MRVATCESKLAAGVADALHSLFVNIRSCRYNDIYTIYLYIIHHVERFAEERVRAPQATQLTQVHNRKEQNRHIIIQVILTTDCGSALVCICTEQRLLSEITEAFVQIKHKKLNAAMRWLLHVPS